MDDHEGDHICPDCYAREVALDLLELAIVNALNAGCDPNDVHDRCVAVLAACCDADDDSDDLEHRPAAGQA